MTRARLVVAGLALPLLFLTSCGPASKPDADPSAQAVAALSGPEARYLAAADPHQLLVGWSGEAMEQAAIAAGAPAARQGDNLILRFTKAPPGVVKNDSAACQAEDNVKCVQHHLLFDLPSRGVMLVGSYAFEDSEVQMYDRASGRAVTLAELPKFSPSGDRLFVRDIPYGSESQGNLQVWRREGDDTVMQASLPIPKVSVPHLDYPINATVEVADWRDDVIDLALSTAAPEHHWPGKLSFQDGRWTLAQTPPADVAPVLKPSSQ